MLVFLFERYADIKGGVWHISCSSPQWSHNIVNFEHGNIRLKDRP